MGFIFTLLYVFVTYLTPTFLFGDLGRYNLLEYLAVATLLVSCIHVRNSGLFSIPQTGGVLALFACVGFSFAFNVGFMSVPAVLLNFAVTSIIYFFVVLNVRTRVQIQWVIAVLIAIAVFSICEGMAAVSAGDAKSPWVYMMGAGDTKFPRINGLGFINDPNDFCQFLVGLIPCVFIFWRRGKFLRNLFFVLAPTSFLLYGMFLTHSRGGMLALLVALVVAGRRKFGVFPALISGGCLFLALSAVGWSGGREISTESGSDRTAAWSTGLVLIRTHPFFGVGYQRFGDFYPITAHNTVVVCAAELGFIGLFFWTLMVVPTFCNIALAARQPNDAPQMDAATVQSPRRSLSSFSSPVAVASALPSSRQWLAFAVPASPSKMDVKPPSPAGLVRGRPPAARSNGTMPPDELRRICNLMMIGLTGFFTAGWFLSRAYSSVVFTYIGLAIAITRLAVESGVLSAPLPAFKAAKYSGITSVVLIAAIYLLLRVTNLLPK